MIWENLNKDKLKNKKSLPKINTSLNNSDDCNLLLSPRNNTMYKRKNKNCIRNLQIKIIKGEYVNKSTTSLFHIKNKHRNALST